MARHRFHPRFAPALAACLVAASCATSGVDEDPLAGEDDDVSADDDTASGTDDDASPSDDDSAADDDSASADDDSAPGDDDTAAGDDDSAPECPDPPPDLVGFTLPEGYGHPVAVMMASGQMGAIALPPVPETHASEQLTFGESAGGAYSPQPVVVEVSIHRCPGVISNDAADHCNVWSTNGSYNSVTYFARPYSVLDDPEAVNAYGYCWAPAEEGPWYANVRWTYDECAFGAATCGFMAQLNLGPY